MTSTLEMPEAGLFADSRITTQAEIIAKHNAWWNGETVFSTMDAVGRIPHSLGILALLHSKRMLRTPYGIVKNDSLLLQTKELTDALREIALADIERCGLEGELWGAVYAGNYDRRSRQPRHVDNYRQPSIRWTVSAGSLATPGTAGMLRKGDTLTTGDLHPDITVAPGGRLEPLDFSELIVVRFMQSGDLHGGPDGDGPRIMGQQTLRLAYKYGAQNTCPPGSLFLV